MKWFYSKFAKRWIRVVSAGSMTLFISNNLLQHEYKVNFK